MEAEVRMCCEGREVKKGNGNARWSESRHLWHGQGAWHGHAKYRRAWRGTQCKATLVFMALYARLGTAWHDQVLIGRARRGHA